MIPKLAVFSFLFFLLSCGTNRVPQIGEDEKQYTDSDIEELAKDCSYIIRKLKKGLKRSDAPVDQKKLKKAESNEYLREQILANDPSWSSQKERRKRRRIARKNLKQYKNKKSTKSYIVPEFYRNDFLVALLSKADCFDGYSSEQIISIFGESTKRPLLEDSSIFLLEYRFKVIRNEYDIMKIEFKDDKLENLKINRSTIITISCPAAF